MESDFPDDKVTDSSALKYKERATSMPYIGSRVKRKEDVRLLRGIGKYVGDIHRAGMVHAAILAEHARACAHRQNRCGCRAETPRRRRRPDGRRHAGS